MSRAQIYDGSEWVPMNAVEPTVPIFDLLNSEKTAADIPDDEFDSTTLDAKWTAVTGSAGTVDPLNTSSVRVYDLATRPGWLLIQGGNGYNPVSLRQDFTLADGDSIVAACVWGSAPSDAETGISLNEQQFGISINDTDSAHNAGNHVRLHWGTIADGTRILCYDGSTTLATTHDSYTDSWQPEQAGTPIFFRIMRDGLTYRFFISTTGMTWQPFGSKTFGTAPSNLWIFGGQLSGGGSPAPIHAVKWFRLGGSGLDPWNPKARVAVDTARYGCIVGRSAAFTFTDAGSGFTVMTWDSELYNEGGCWDSANGSRFTAPVAGFYTLISHVGVQTGSLSSDLIVWRHTVDGAVKSYITHVWPNSDWPVYHQSFTVWMEAGEYLELWYQNDNSSYTGWNSTTITRASFMRVG